MRGVPRGVAAAVPVVMTDLGAAGVAAGPVVAGVIRLVGKVRGAVVLSAGEDVVLVGLVVSTLDALAVLVERGFERDRLVV